MSGSRQHPPLYQQIAQDVAAKIDRGEWRAGDRLPSERSLCKKYEVSQITVRRALRELSSLNKVYSRHGLGWFVSDHPAVPAGPAEVLMLLPDLCWPLNRLTVDVIQLLQRAGRAVRLLFEDADAASAKALLRAAEQEGARVALVTATGTEQSLRALYADMDAELSLLFLLRAVPCLDIPTAALDERGAMRTVTQHLISLGHRHIAYVGDDPATISGWERYQGFRDALWSQGLELPLDWTFAESPTQGAEAARFQALFSARTQPTAIACASDERAAEVLQALHKAGHECPQVAVVGLGDSELAVRAWPPLTTFRFDLGSLAQAVTDMTLGLLSTRRATSTRVSGELVVRQSCGAAL